MKILALLITCLFPVFSFANAGLNSNSSDTFVEQCAKEQDPVKRQHSCHMLDRHSETLQKLPDFHQETATV